MAASSPIEHVVVVMLENRSFDHLLGHLDHGGLVPVGPGDTNPIDGASIAAHFLPDDRDVTVDPGHGFGDVVAQLTGVDPPLRHEDIDNKGFVRNYRRQLERKRKDVARANEIMGCHASGDVPVLSTLAREFAVCSRWFCSVPSETWPNRLFAHGAQSEGLVENDPRPYEHRTIFDALIDAGRTWAIYAGDLPQTAAYAELNHAFKDRFNLFGEFSEDVLDGTLPAYSFIEPRHFLKVNSQHPTHSVLLGDQLLRRVYTTLTANDEIWRSVLLIVTWDEHGGFFDREKPPKTVSPTDHQGQRGFGFDVLGVRVPAVVVSPWIPRLTVDDEVRDHTTIIRTVFEALGVDEHLTKRDEQARSLLPLLTAKDARPAPELAPPSRRIARAVAEEGSPEPVELDDLQRSLIELTRVLDKRRPARRRSLQPMPEPEAITTPDEIERLVHHFQLEHMGSRARRLRP